MSFASIQSRPSIARGDVHWVDFGRPAGRELCGIHPAIVTSTNVHNSNRLSPLVRVIPLTTQRRPARHDEVVITPTEGGIYWPSLARVIQARPVDRRCVLGRLGRVSGETMEKIEDLIAETNGIGVRESHIAV
jgi:mRNA-degrading endonuclease toxin of MazEF toxin-antitoxin module